MLKAGSIRKCYDMSVYFRQIWIFIHNWVLLRLYRYNGNDCTTKLVLTKFRVYSESIFNTAVRWVLLSLWNQRIIKSWKYNKLLMINDNKKLIQSWYFTFKKNGISVIVLPLPLSFFLTVIHPLATTHFLSSAVRWGEKVLLYRLPLTLLNVGKIFIVWEWKIPRNESKWSYIMFE